MKSLQAFCFVVTISLLASGCRRAAHEIEPNYDRFTATPFDQDAIVGAIMPADDLDWYRVDVPADQRYVLAVNLSGVPGMDLQLSLRDSQGVELLVVNKEGPGTGEALMGYTVEPGIYYLVVSEVSRKAQDPLHPYTLTKQLIPISGKPDQKP